MTDVVPDALFPEETVPYPSFLYATLLTGLRKSFALHPDPYYKKTMCIYEYTTDEIRFPLIILRYYGRTIKNSGVGNKDIIEIEGFQHAFEHYYYEGDIEFECQALDPLSRDRLAGSLVHLISQGTMDTWSGKLFDSVYGNHDDILPYRDFNFVNINSDEITPFGNVQVPAPWNSENELVFKTTYRTNVLGEFTSLPDAQPLTTVIEKVLLYPYSLVEGDTVPFPDWQS